MKNNDLISRSALLKAWREIRGVCVPDLVVDCMIGEAPAVDAEPVRHGLWEHGMQCSFCKQVDTAKPNYCPSCGAKMDAEVKL